MGGAQFRIEDHGILLQILKNDACLLKVVSVPLGMRIIKATHDPQIIGRAGQL